MSFYISSAAQHYNRDTIDATCLTVHNLAVFKTVNVF